MKKAQTRKSLQQKRLIEEPTLNNLNHVFEVYEESGSDNDNIEDSLKGESKKNLKEKDYTNIEEKKEGKRADLLNMENHNIIMIFQEKMEKMRKLWSPRKWCCQTLGKTFS